MTTSRLWATCPRDGPTNSDGGHYRLHRRDDEALFGYAVGPHSWKKFLLPATQRLWSAERTESGVVVTPGPHPIARFAFIGVRACDLHAIAIEDRVLIGGEHVDPRYQRRRRGAFIVPFNCGVAGGTCFCASMHTGPKTTGGYDLALTELIGDGEHGAAGGLVAAALRCPDTPSDARQLRALLCP
jgi:sulfhydrogenase subunit beta (sulfur reductase)